MLVMSLVLVFGLVACGDKNNTDNSSGSAPVNPLLGEWRENRDDGFATTHNFLDDGKGESYTLDMVNYFSYTYDTNTITMEVHVEDPPVKRVFTYKIENDTLTLSQTGDDGVTKDTVYTKVKK